MTRCHHVAFKGSSGPHPVVLAPYTSRVEYSKAYVGPKVVWESSAEKELTSARQVYASRISNVCECVH